jgi:hypothetical protein
MLEINTEGQLGGTESDPRLTRDFLRYFEEESVRRRAEVNRQEVTTNLQNYLLCLIAKYKHNTSLSEEYVRLKPKYVYVGARRVEL